MNLPQHLVKKTENKNGYVNKFTYKKRKWTIACRQELPSPKIITYYNFFNNPDNIHTSLYSDGELLTNSFHEYVYTLFFIKDYTWLKYRLGQVSGLNGYNTIPAWYLKVKYEWK